MKIRFAKYPFDGLVHHYQPECNEPFTSPAPSVKKALRTHKYN